MADLSTWATGGAKRPDSFSGMQGGFSSALEALFADAPPELQGQLLISSGYRSPERQAQLWSDAVKKYGSASAARKWVAPPGNSQHNKGNAADLKFMTPEARAWVHANASKYGLSFPLGNEPWHIELATARGGPQPTLAYAPMVKKTPAAAAIDAAAPKKGSGLLGGVFGGIANGISNVKTAALGQIAPVMVSAQRIDPKAEIMKRVNPLQIALYMMGNHATPIQGSSGLLNPITQRSAAWLNATGNNQPIMRAASAPALVGAAGVRGQNGRRDFGNRTSDGVARSLV